MAKHEKGCQCETCSPSGVEWATPTELMDIVRDTYGPLTLDVAANVGNAKAPAFITKEQDALSQDWVQCARLDSNVALKPHLWCNPPYGRGIGLWIQLARRAAMAGVPVTLLVPAKTDTIWWNEEVVGPPISPLEHSSRWVERNSYSGLEVTWRSLNIEVTVWFLYGRIKFNDAKGTGRFPSALIHFEQFT